jgi:DNA-binding IclR family transcriptional regulator
MRILQLHGAAIIMTMKVSVSRSVGRAFAVMDLFREAQTPASATQIRRRLDAPHSSVVAILQNLRELGFLSFNETDMTYFPTTKLHDLSAWLRPPARDPGQISGLVDRVAHDTGHMTALSSRLLLFVNTVAQRSGRFSTVSAPPASVGPALIETICGHVILAQLDDDEIADIMHKTDDWLLHAGARKSFDKARTLASIDLARRKGFLSGAQATCRSTEIIAYAVKGAAASPLALSVHIPSSLSRESKEDVRQMLEARVLESQVISRKPKSMRPGQSFAGGFSLPVRDGIAPRACPPLGMTPDH